MLQITQNVPNAQFWVFLLLSCLLFHGAAVDARRSSSTPFPGWICPQPLHIQTLSTQPNSNTTLRMTNPRNLSLQFSATPIAPLPVVHPNPLCLNATPSTQKMIADLQVIFQRFIQQISLSHPHSHLSSSFDDHFRSFGSAGDFIMKYVSFCIIDLTSSTSNAPSSSHGLLASSVLPSSSPFKHIDEAYDVVVPLNAPLPTTSTTLNTHGLSTLIAPSNLKNETIYIQCYIAPVGALLSSRLRRPSSLLGNFSVPRGCHYAMQTLAQLVYFDPDASTMNNTPHAQQQTVSGMMGSFRVASRILVPVNVSASNASSSSSVSLPYWISDVPRFSHRGLLIDTSRHFLPVPFLQQVIDSMTFVKLNVLHLHLTDAVAFPFQSKVFPALGANGAWSASERYTISDLRQGIVEYAQARGVRVILEVDTPAHSAAMCKGMPAALCPNPLCSSWSLNSWMFDITKNESVFHVIEGLLKELTSTVVMEEPLLHLGGDELDFSCWEQHADIVLWFQQRNWTFTDGIAWYLETIQNYTVSTLEKVSIVWEEMWTLLGPDRIDKHTIVEQWRSSATASFARNVTSHGFSLLWSSIDAWYLDDIFTEWETSYSVDPCEGLDSTSLDATRFKHKEVGSDDNGAAPMMMSLCDLVLGGEACLWGEFVDPSDLFPSLWPRLAAAAERLWSDPVKTSNISFAAVRLPLLKCWLNGMGVEAAPVNNILARSAPLWPGPCDEQ